MNARLEINPEIMLGKPVIKGTRISVELILRRLAEGMTMNELLESYSHITKEDIHACFLFASNLIANEEIIIPKSP